MQSKKGQVHRVTGAASSQLSSWNKDAVDDDWLKGLELRRSSFLPLHRQIHDLLRDEIVTGRLESGTRLPSEGSLAEHWHVSLAPVRQALAGLAAEGWIDREQGRGTFVRQSKFDEKLSILSSFSSSHAEQGDRPELELLYLGKTAAPADVAAALGLPARKAMLIRRLARLDSSPVALLSAYLSPVRFPGLERRGLQEGSLYRTLDEVYGVEFARAQSMIEVVRACDDEAEPLGLAVGAMVLQVTSITYDKTDEEVEFSRVLYRVERFRFSLDSYRIDDRVAHFPGPSAHGRRSR